jgi:ABC-type sugar transport system permease subunit
VGLELARPSPVVAAGRGEAGVSLRRIRTHWMFYLSVSPFFVLFAIFGAIPIGYAFYAGFTRWDGLTDPQWIGLSNYTRLLDDPVFRTALVNTLYIWIGSTVLTVGLAFGLAYLINEYVFVGRSFFRVVFLFPLLVAPAVTAIIVGVLFSPTSGIVNAVWGLFAGHKVSFDWLDSTRWIKPIIILMIAWRWTGWHFIIFLSGLQTIPRDLYDAARIDGANGFQVFRTITFPLMIPVLLFSVVSATVGGLQVFDEPYVLTNGSGGTLNSGNTLGMYVYQTAFQEFHFGRASAMSYVVFALIAIFSLVNVRLLRART